MRILLLFFCLGTLFQGCQAMQSDPAVKVGARVLLDKHLDELEGKRVGLVMNHTARLGNSHMLDTLLAHDVNITALFAPEHGFRGEVGAGETIEDGIDQATGLPVFSLYGNSRKPTPRMLRKVDVLLFDMQDVGARFYTYNATLGNVIEAAAPAGIPVWVLDRPNPAGGNYISGWMMQDRHQSFVGRYPIPMVHGMTLGELARMMVGEGWIDHAGRARIKVIPMEGWKRSMRWPETGLEWIPPSPNLPTFDHAFIYLGTVLFEGINISEGRGTPDPFLNIGSPATELRSSHINELQRSFSGVQFERVTFVPESIPGKAVNPDFEGQRCRGIKIRITDPHKFSPVELGAKLMSVMLEATPGARLKDYIEKLTGIDKDAFLKQLERNTYSEQWGRVANRFAKERKEYLIY